MKIISFATYFLLTLVLLILISARPSHAMVISYTDHTAFQSAISGMTSQTLDFEGLTPAETIPSGTEKDRITFSYSISGETMMVSNIYDTTSPYNCLGLTGGDNAFQYGDSFDLSFSSPINALGMYFITSDDAYEGDIEISTIFGSAYNE